MLEARLHEEDLKDEGFFSKAMAASGLADVRWGSSRGTRISAPTP